MLRFVYWLNKKVWKEQKLFECYADSILDADKLFQKEKNINPMKRNDIGCELFRETQLQFIF